MATPQEIVQQFQQLFNNRDLDGLRALIDPDVRYNGVQGNGEGAHLLNEWVERATTTLTPQRWFGADDTVVVENLVEWRVGGQDRVTDSTTWAFAYVIADGVITSISRFTLLGEAVTKSGMHEHDEMDIPYKP